MKIFPLTIGDQTFYGIDDLKAVPYGTNAHGTPVTLYSYFSKWRKIRKSTGISFADYLNQVTEDAYLTFPISANKPAQVQTTETMADVTRRLLSLAYGSEASFVPSTIMEEVVWAQINNARQGNNRAATLLGCWMNDPKKIQVEGSIDSTVKADVALKQDLFDLPDE